MNAIQLQIPNLDTLIAEANPKPVVRPQKNPGRPISRINSHRVPASQYTQMDFTFSTAEQISGSHQS
jgi:hypothetical protein